jgi:nucleoside 2-deoxyribosyltransferase
MQNRPKIYLAGPEVFLPNAVEVGSRKKAACHARGLTGLFPFDNELPGGGNGRIDRLIYAANRRMMEEADAAIFNLTPLRGPSADPGTVFELGLMSGLGKMLFGYTNSASDMAARIGKTERGADGLLRDAHGLSVEDYGNADNLMIDGCLAEHGNHLLRFDGGGRLDILTGFEACLDILAGQLLGTVANQQRRKVRALG